MNRRLALASICVAFMLTAMSCSEQSSDVSDTARKALAPVTTPTTTTTPPTAATPPPPDDPFCLTSADPMAPLPAPGTAGGRIREIYDRQFLVAGIDENTPHLGERDPRDATFHGFEVELVREVAARIFGDRDPARVRFKTVVTKEKNSVVEKGEVDLTASADSINCERKQKVDFSHEYLETGHVLLVRAADGITSKDQLDGRPVCVTAGSSSVKLLAAQMPKARPFEVDARNDCLVALQQGEADAYLGHTTFARGMAEQDGDMVILPDSLAEQHYGIAISRDHPELVAFVNGVLQEMRDSGRLADLFAEYGLPDSEMPR